MAKNGNPKIIAIKQTVQLIDSLEQYKDLCKNKTNEIKRRTKVHCQKEGVFSSLSFASWTCSKDSHCLFSSVL